MDKIRISTTRFKNNFDALGNIGATINDGVHRPTFSIGHSQARRWFRDLSRKSGLGFSVDSAGNHIARLDCSSTDAPTLIIGSHLDSVPNGGRFDGALGVVAALEVLLTIQNLDIWLPFNLEAIDFTDEEGTFLGLLGSSALGGKLQANGITQKSLGNQKKLEEGFERLGLSVDDIFNTTRDPGRLIGYLELHIEQGKILENSNSDIGIVTSIIGINSFRLTFIGRADHAGTTSMVERLDASQGAAAFILDSRTITLNDYPNCVANIGKANLFPGAGNIVPETAELHLEFRAPDQKSFKELEKALLKTALENAVQYGLGFEIEHLGKHSPALMAGNIQKIITMVTKSMGLKSIQMASTAGHDAQSLADICPTGMIFVPSVDGSSHSPRELTLWDDCINGANVLLQTVLHWDNPNFPKK